MVSVLRGAEPRMSSSGKIDDGATDGDPGGPRPGGYLRPRSFAVDARAFPIAICLLATAAIAMTVGVRDAQGFAAAIIAVAICRYALSRIGERVPFVRAVGLGTVAVVFVPSYLVYAGGISARATDEARIFLASSDAIGVFIAILITGSIAGIDRRGLIAGLAKIVLPLSLGSIVAAASATLVGTAFGLKPFDALFLVAAPIMGGGITAGALPLSVGYEDVLVTSQGEMLARMLPAVILGNFTAMVCAGLLASLEGGHWTKRSALSGSAGGLPGLADGEIAAACDGKESPGDLQARGAAVAIIVALYVAGTVASRIFDAPAPLIVLALAATLLLADVLSPRIRASIVAIYRFCVAAFTGPVLFAVGLVLTPWGKLVEGFAPANLATIVAAVGSLSVAGFLASRWIGLAPVDGAIVTVTRAAMGGTGDIAVLSAGGRMELMPFAQISTRIGGAATVAAALAAAEHFGR